MFKTTDAALGIIKWFIDWSAPAKSAALEIKKRKGKTIFKYGAVSITCSGENPGAINLTRGVVKKKTKKVSKRTIPSKNKNAVVKKRQAASFLLSRISFTNSGINEADRAPSANIFWRN